VKPLPNDAIKQHLARLKGWEQAGNTIRRAWTFADFKGSMAFVNRVAGLAEEMDHHPDIDIRYSRVTLVLSTHDAGGLTARDFALAEKIGE
jgi:4a-hydroxytetrahydrobiopterin dehydratase